MPYEVELRLPALTSCLHVVTACVRRLCRTTIGSEDQEFQQAVYAACGYAIQSAYGGDAADQQLELCFYASDGELLVELTDHGYPYIIVEPDIRMDEIDTLYRLADEVRYEHHAAGNSLTLVRRSKCQRAVADI